MTHIHFLFESLLPDSLISFLRREMDFDEAHNP
jgi:hypothetical protein